MLNKHGKLYIICTNDKLAFFQSMLGKRSCEPETETELKLKFSCSNFRCTQRIREATSQSELSVSISSSLTPVKVTLKQKKEPQHNEICVALSHADMTTQTKLLKLQISFSLCEYQKHFLLISTQLSLKMKVKVIKL